MHQLDHLVVHGGLARPPRDVAAQLADTLTAPRKGDASVRSRWWIVLTVIVVLAVGFGGIGAALLFGATPAPESRSPDGTPSSGPGQAASFELRQVYFQESGDIARQPPLAPGPAGGGKDATRNLLRVDCQLAPRPMAPDDKVILCDTFGFRYGLGPSELSAGAVADAIALQGQTSGWVVQVTLTPDAAAVFADVTARVAALGPPLNQLAIVLNGAVVSAPRVEEPINGGALQITGDFTQDEAQALAASLV